MAKNLIQNRLIFYPPKNPTDLKRITDLLLRSPQDSLILPYIDTPGPLSDQILSKNFRSLTVCERDDKTRELFRTLVRNRCINQKISIRDDNLIASSFKASFDSGGTNCSSIIRENLSLGGIDTSRGSCGDTVNILVPLLTKKYEASFMAHLFYQFCLRLGLCQDVLVNYYMLVSHRHYKLLNAQAGTNLSIYRRTSVLPNMIFKMHWLQTFDLRDCFNVDLRRINSSSQNLKSNPFHQQIHLVWLEPNLKFLDSMGPQSFLELKFLVTQMMAKRKTLVFKFLDKWFEDCSPYLSTIGITKETRSGDLKGEDYLRIFLYLRGLPGYKSSTFIHAVSSCEPWYQRFQDQCMRATGTY